MWVRAAYAPHGLDSCVSSARRMWQQSDYIATWLKVLGKYTRVIFVATGKVTETANYMRSVVNPEQGKASGTFDE